jgi:hypothetical protein
MVGSTGRNGSSFPKLGFCNGPMFVNPFFTYETSVRRGHASVRGRRMGRHLMGFDEDRSTNLKVRVVCATAQFAD